MRGWLRELLRELTRGVPLLTFVAIAVTMTVLLWSRGEVWGGRWNTLAWLSREYLILLAGITMAFAAWQGGRASRDGMRDLLGSTRASALLRQSVEVVAVTLAAYLGVLIGVATAGVSIVRLGGWGSSAAVYQFLGMAPALLAYAALGYAIGRALPGRVVAPFAGLAGYLLLAVPMYVSKTVPVLFGNGFLGDDVHREFSVRTLLLSGAGLAAAAIFFLALAALERRPAPSRPTRAVSVTAGVAMVGLAPLTLASAAAALDNPAPSNPPVVCTTDDGPRVCVHAQDRVALDEATRQAREVIAALEGIHAAPTWAGPRALAGAETVEMLPVEPAWITPWGELNASRGAPVLVDPFALFDPSASCTSAGWPAPAEAKVASFYERAHLLTRWLRGDEADWEWLASPDTVGVSELERRFAVSTDEQRLDFASAVREAALTCHVNAVVAADRHLAPAP